MNGGGCAEVGAPEMTLKLEQLKKEARAERRRHRRERRRELKLRKTRKKRRGRQTIPSISLDVFHHALEVLKTDGVRVLDSHKPVMLTILRRVLHPFSIGAPIRNRDYPKNPGLMSRFKKFFTSQRLMVCKDEDSWKSEVGQLFFPSPNLVEKNLSGKAFKASYREYCRVGKNSPARPVEVRLDKRAKGIISPGLEDALKKGTGLFINREELLDKLRRLYPNILTDENQRTEYCDIVRSVGAGGGELVPKMWRQAADGMMFASDPAVQTIPKEFAKANLRSIDGKRIRRIDCKCFHLVLWLGELAAGKILEEDFDYYADLCEKVRKSGLEVERDEMKGEVVSMLSGRTSETVLWNSKLAWKKRQRSSTIQEPLQQIILRDFPAQWLELRRNFGDDENNDFLNRKGARLFYPCVSSGIRQSGLEKVGILLHDGLVFSGDESQFESFKAGFSSEARRLLGYELPIEAGPF